MTGMIKKIAHKWYKHLGGAAALGCVLAFMALPAAAATEHMPGSLYAVAPQAQTLVNAPGPIQYAQAGERRISASQAKSAAQSRVPGASFVNVQLVSPDTYRVRLQQKNGKIVDVYVDARTGQVKN